ncbi:MAG: DotU family type IV/VI secretion system protein [Gammaproteobacteria bacterium]|nr:DotU family type IV/VI secretion system protein [Gammaproteobacteria bacterium]
MKLIDAFLPLLAYVNRFRENPALLESLSCEAVKTEIERMLVKSSQSASAYGYKDEQYECAKFAIVVYIDETLLSFSWAGRSDWLREMLQKVHFDSANGGAAFYQRLDSFNPVNPAEKDIREVFFYVLCLGFKGRFYRQEDQVQRQQLMQTSYAMLYDKSALEGEQIFTTAYGDPVISKQISRTINLDTVVFGLPLIVMTALFFVGKNEILAMTKKIVMMF